MSWTKDILKTRQQANTGDLPPSLWGYAWGRTKESPGSGQLVLADPASQVTKHDDGLMMTAHIISTIHQDRMGDVMVPEGGDLRNYSRNPVVFFGHQLKPLPIGKSRRPDRSVAVTIHPGRQVTAECYYLQSNPDAHDIYAMVREEGLGMTSIGFNPLARPIPLDPRTGISPTQGGYRFEKWELLEWSIVGIPCNPYCEQIRGYLTDGMVKHGSGRPLSPMLVKALEPLAAPAREWVTGGWAPRTKGFPMHQQSRDSFGQVKSWTPKARPPVVQELEDPVRWNKALPTEFDVANEPLKPAHDEFEWASRWIGCEVKHLHVSGAGIPSVLMGNYLTALKQALVGHELIDTRNLAGGGREAPPIHKTIELNSTKRDDFLIDGQEFYKAAWGNFIVKREPAWHGITITIYAEDKNASASQGILDTAERWSKENNFLKGEAFALSGEFLPRTSEGWDDVFLEAHNKATLKRTIDLFNVKGKAFANRGQIFVGPPGTGKTLSGRIIRNQAQGTFIWISSRDFHRSGSFGGFSFGFEMARELAPSVLFFEDVDNWLHPTTVDLLKTEMDGIARNSGVLTILTTNFPEQMPEALIDRPGRFHDVLCFALPTEKARREMLGHWLPALPAKEVEQAVKATDGYSGAHCYELAQFAKTLQEHDGMEATTALREALRKVEEQRELITNVQLAGSRYRPTRDFGETTMSKKWGKARRVSLSKKDGMTADSGTGGGYTVPESMGIHRVRCMKEVYPTRPQAEETVKGLGYMVDNYHEQDESHDFLQSKPEDHEGDFVQEDHPSMKGVCMLCGKKKAQQVQPAEKPQGAGGEKPTKPEKPMIEKKRFAPVERTWSDEARKAALVARRAHSTTHGSPHMGEEEREHARAAQEATLDAHASNSGDDHEAAAAKHATAAALHQQAARKAREAGDGHWEGKHREAASAHRQAAESHGHAAADADEAGKARGDRENAKSTKPSKLKDGQAPKDPAEPDDDDDLDGDEDDDTEGSYQDHPDMPHGAACLLAVLEHIDAELPRAEPEVAEFLEQMHEEVLSWAEERYPDVDFDGSGGSDDQPGNIGDLDGGEEDEETDEALAKYRYDLKPRLVKNWSAAARAASAAARHAHAATRNSSHATDETHGSSETAHAASEQANASGASRDHFNASVRHEDAAFAHEDAFRAAKRAGDHVAAESHRAAYGAHRDAADIHLAAERESHEAGKARADRENAKALAKKFGSFWLKCMGKDDHEVIKGAAGFLERLSGIDEKAFCHDHKMMCKGHCHSLNDVAKRMASEVDDPEHPHDGQEPAQPEQEKVTAPITKAAPEPDLKVIIEAAMAETMGGLSDSVYRLTGKRPA